MANVLKALTQRFQRHQLNDSPNQVKPAPASETVDTVEGTPLSSDSEDEQQSKPESKVKHAEKRRHLKATSGSSSSDEELRELNKKTKLTAQLSHQHYFLTQLPSRKKVKILPYSKTSIGRPYIDFNKMQSSRMVRRPIPRVRPGTQHHSFCEVQYSTPVMQLDLPKPMVMERFKPVVQT